MGWKSCQIYKKKNLNEMLIFLPLFIVISSKNTFTSFLYNY